MTYNGSQDKINRTEVRQNAIVGRYLINSPEVACSSGDVLIEELPFVLGPKCNGPVLCLECFCPVMCNVVNENASEISAAKERCMVCGWPLCVKCQENENSKYHQKYECNVFSKVKAKFYNILNDEKGCPQLDCITTLRYSKFAMYFTHVFILNYACSFC